MSTDTGEPAAAVGPVPADLLDHLALTSFTVMALLSRTAAEHDMSLTQFRMMAILRDRTPTMAELADFLGLERSSVSGLIDRVARRGLAQRTASRTDGRAVQVSLTADGHRLADQVAAEVSGLIAPLTSALTTAEQKRLTELLGKLLAPGRHPVEEPTGR
jgi:DNA-binding MarR family transcriptional regulator